MARGWTGGIHWDLRVAALDFYEDLEDDNSKTFWTKHKHVYDESVKVPMEALAAALEAEFGPAKLFRPYRDVRFAKDKTPYKTHQGAWFGESSRCTCRSALPACSYRGWLLGHPDTPGGTIYAVPLPTTCCAGAALDRAHHRGDEGQVPNLGGHQLSRVPGGYDKDHPRAELLKYKTLTVSRELGSPAWLATAKAKAEIVKLLRGMSPVVEWLETHVGRE